MKLMTICTTAALSLVLVSADGLPVVLSTDSAHDRFIIRLATSSASECEIVPVSDRDVLREAVNDCAASASQDGWDGAGTFAVSKPVLVTALRIVDLFPPLEDFPEVDVTPAGSLSFSWHKGSGSQLSVLVPKQGVVSFAGYFGGDRINGVLALPNDQLPEEILAAIRRWIAS